MQDVTRLDLVQPPCAGHSHTFVDHFAATRVWKHRQWKDELTAWEMKRYLESI